MIHTKDLCYTYPDGPSLRFPDVALAPGGVLLLTGPSGCGKSTWLALIAGLVQPSKGYVCAAGQDLALLGLRQIDRWRSHAVGFLPQKLYLSSALTVQQNLEMALWAADASHQNATIQAALGKLGIADLAKRLPRQLSGGQAQRVALARAVLLQPSLLLADEPTASLDDAAAAAVIALLCQTAQADRSVPHVQPAYPHKTSLVIVTHDARVPALLAQHLDKPGLQPLQQVQLSPISHRQQEAYL